MSRTRKQRPAEDGSAPVSAPRTDPRPGPTPGSLAGLVALGAFAALWSLFLWAELLVTRAGGTAFCAFGEAADCAALWDAPFASGLHRMSGVPVAGWGLAWSLVAFALPLLALLRRAEGGSDPALVTAIRLTSGAGAGAALVLFGVALTARTFCLGCFVTYVIVAGYAGIALSGWRGLGLPDAPRGASLAAGLALAAYAALLYPGLRTPRSAVEAGREAVAASPALDAGPGTGDAVRDRDLAAFVASLDPRLKQTLADSLHVYRTSPVLPVPAARSLGGPADAPVRITAWTDVLCDHCADLHETLDALADRLPRGSFSVDSRQFPLDGACNPQLRPRPEESVRCLAAKALICLAGAPGHDFAGALYREQKGLSPERVFALAAPYVNRPALEACIASEATRARLEEDTRLGAAYDPHGTPIVAVNGRRGTSFGPFLYAIVLTRGAPDHPAFASLPSPDPNAHLH